jgi:hypothetical protein
MRENRTSGTEWGVLGNRHSYHNEKMKGENKDENQIAQMDNDRDYLHNNPGIWLCMVNWR